MLQMIIINITTVTDYHNYDSYLPPDGGVPVGGGVVLGTAPAILFIEW